MSWLYDGATTVNIGLAGSEHTRQATATRDSFSRRAERGGEGHWNFPSLQRRQHRFGPTPWLYDGVTTIAIGLTDTEHTRNDGYRNSNRLVFSDEELNEAGQVIGCFPAVQRRQHRFGPDCLALRRRDHDRIGLTGPEHTRSDGYKYSLAQPTERGGAGRPGAPTVTTAAALDWAKMPGFYDPVLDQTFTLQLSTRSDGYAFSQRCTWVKTVWSWGLTTCSTPLGNNLGSRAFYFTIADGLHDLGSLVDGGLVANGWDSLATPMSRSGLGQDPRRRQAHFPIRRPNAVSAHPCRPRAEHLDSGWFLIHGASICFRRSGGVDESRGVTLPFY